MELREKGYKHVSFIIDNYSWELAGAGIDGRCLPIMGV
jgi:hypothetical protein